MNRKTTSGMLRLRRGIRTYRNLKRTRQILIVFLKYGFGDLLERLKVEYWLKIRRKFGRIKEQEELQKLQPAVRLRLAFSELGPTFIKMGQILSTRPDLIPPHFAREFGKLRDEAAPFPSELVEEQLEANFRQPVSQLFAEFDPQPIASASISQVHRAVLHSGEIVAVKIQRPGIRRIVESDIQILRDIAALITRTLPDLAIYNPQGIVEEFDKSIHREMDFLREARNIERFHRNFQHNPVVVVPEVFWAYTTEKVLTTHFLEGEKFSSLMERPLSKEIIDTIVEHGSAILIKMIFEYGFFHADPHPGNLLLLAGNRIGFLDFGMMGSIDEVTRTDLAELLYGIIQKDLNLVIRKLEAITEFPEELNYRALRNDLSDFIDRYYDVPIANINFERLINDLLEISHRFKIAFPPDLVLMFRALMISESLVRAIYPEYNMVDQAKPIIRQLVWKKYEPGRKLRELFVFLEDTEELVRSLPQEMTTIFQKMKKGQFRVQFQHQNLEDLVTELELTSTRLSFSLIIAAIIVGSSLIIHSDKGPYLFGYPLLGLIGFLLAGIMGGWLVFNILRSGKLR